jgi:hypothetical protein
VQYSKYLYAEREMGIKEHQEIQIEQIILGMHLQTQMAGWLRDQASNAA